MSVRRRFAAIERPEAGTLALNAGALHLFFAGAVNVAAGAWLAYLAYTDRLLSAAIQNASLYVTKATALRRGQLLALLATDGALVVGALVVLVGLTGCAVAWEGAFRRRSLRRCLLAGVCNACNPLALPLALVGIVLVGASRTEFADGPTGD